MRKFWELNDLDLKSSLYFTFEVTWIAGILLNCYSPSISSNILKCIGVSESEIIIQELNNTFEWDHFTLNKEVRSSLFFKKLE